RRRAGARALAACPAGDAAPRPVGTPDLHPARRWPPEFRSAGDSGRREDDRTGLSEATPPNGPLKGSDGLCRPGRPLATLGEEASNERARAAPVAGPLLRY